MNISTEEAFGIIAAFAAISGIIWRWTKNLLTPLHEKIRELSGRIDKVEEKTSKIQKETSDSIKELSDSFSDFKSDVLTRAEFREDLKEFKADLLMALRVNTK